MTRRKAALVPNVPAVPTLPPLPSTEELLSLVARLPGSTKQLAAAIWPNRPWYVNHHRCQPHESAQRLAEALTRLVAQGALVEVHLADEVDALAQRGWRLPGETVAPPRPPRPPRPRPNDEDMRRMPRLAGSSPRPKKG